MAKPEKKNETPRRGGFLASDSFLVACGGILGTYARNGLEHLVIPPHALLPGFPWPTFLVNMSGAALLGFILAWVEECDDAPSWLRPFAAIGFCGAYTTFSTASVEVLLLARDGHTGVALSYVVASFVIGILLVTLTTMIAARMFNKTDSMKGERTA